MRKWVVLFITLFANSVSAEITDCPVIYKATTLDHKKEIFLCEARSTMVFSVGSVGEKPDILATVSYEKSFIKKDKNAKGVESTQLYLSVSGKWFIIDFDKDKTILTTEEMEGEDYVPDDIAEQPLEFDKKTEVNNIGKLTKVR